MRKQFADANLHDRYPFGELEYYRDRKRKAMHLCPERLQWAFDHWNTPPVGQSEELTKFYKAWYWWASSIDGVSQGYAIYSRDDTGKIVRERCTKAQYEAAKVRNKPWHVEFTTDPEKI